MEKRSLNFNTFTWLLRRGWKVCSQTENTYHFFKSNINSRIFPHVSHLELQHIKKKDGLHLSIRFDKEKDIPPQPINFEKCLFNTSLSKETREVPSDLRRHFLNYYKKGWIFFGYENHTESGYYRVHMIRVFNKSYDKKDDENEKKFIWGYYDSPEQENPIDVKVMSLDVKVENLS